MASAAVIGAFGLLPAAAWLYVASRLARRRLPPEHRAAGRALVVAMSAGGAGIAMSAVAATMGDALGAAALPAAWIGTALGVAMAGGLVAYLAHLVTGSRHAVTLVAAGTIVAFAALVAVLLALEPTGAVANGWTIRFVFARASERANPILAVAVLAPAALASIAYLALLPRAADATARWRIALVGGGFALWLATALGTRLVGADTAPLALARAAGLVATLAVLLAYAPPRWASERWGVRNLAAEVARPPPDPLRIAALAARLRQLI